MPTTKLTLFNSSSLKNILTLFWKKHYHFRKAFCRLDRCLVKPFYSKFVGLQKNHFITNKYLVRCLWHPLVVGQQLGKYRDLRNIRRLQYSVKSGPPTPWLAVSRPPPSQRGSGALCCCCSVKCCLLSTREHSVKQV